MIAEDKVVAAARLLAWTCAWSCVSTQGNPKHKLECQGRFTHSAGTYHNHFMEC